jgi:hypothetical protein
MVKIVLVILMKKNILMIFIMNDDLAACQYQPTPEQVRARRNRIQETITKNKLAS